MKSKNFCHIKISEMNFSFRSVHQIGSALGKFSWSFENDKQNKWTESRWSRVESAVCDEMKNNLFCKLKSFKWFMSDSLWKFNLFFSCYFIRSFGRFFHFFYTASRLNLCIFFLKFRLVSIENCSSSHIAGFRSLFFLLAIMLCDRDAIDCVCGQHVFVYFLSFVPTMFTRFTFILFRFQRIFFNACRPKVVQAPFISILPLIRSVQFEFVFFFSWCFFSLTLYTYFVAGNFLILTPLALIV